MRTTTMLSHLLIPSLLSLLATSLALQHPHRAPPDWSYQTPPTFPGNYYDPLPKTRAASPPPTRTNPPLRRTIGETHTNITLLPLRFYLNSTVNMDELGGCTGKAPNSSDYYMNDARGDMKVSLGGGESDPPTNDTWSKYCGAKIRITGPDGRQCEATIVSGCNECFPWGLGLMRKPWEAVGGGEKDMDYVPEASWEVIG